MDLNPLCKEQSQPVSRIIPPPWLMSCGNHNTSYGQDARKTYYAAAHLFAPLMGEMDGLGS